MLINDLKNLLLNRIIRAQHMLAIAISNGDIEHIAQLENEIYEAELALTKLEE